MGTARHQFSVWDTSKKRLDGRNFGRRTQHPLNAATKKTTEEVGAARMEDLVTCPFCLYQTIIESPDDQALVCRNP